MKLVIDEVKKNSKGKKIKDGVAAKTFKTIILKSAKPQVGDINSVPANGPIEFGNPWVEYSFSKSIAKPEDRESYEWFCCGYLFYYDEITRNGAVDHGIHFVWESETKVAIYLYPGPIVVKPGSGKYKNFPRSEDAQKDYFRGQNFDDEYLLPAGGGIDPQPPPPPPPPPQEM